MRGIIGLLGCTILSTAAFAQDPVVVNADHVKVEFQNDQVRVLRNRYAPGEKSSFHTHPARVGVWMTDTHTRSTTADGKVAEITASAGKTFWIDPLTQPHMVENIGDRPSEAVEIEFIGKPGAPLPAPSPDPVKIDPQHCKVEFENDQVRVLRWTVPPHERAPLHEHGPGVYVLLTDLWTKGTDADGKPTEGKASAGAVAWGSAHRHADENASDNPLEVIHFEMKTAPATAPK